MPLAIIDTNVLVYAFDPRDQARQERAIAVLLKLEETGDGRLSIQSLSEFAKVVLAKQGLPPAEIPERIDQWCSAFPVFLVNPQTILEAVRGVHHHQLSYYDAQIWACARLNQVPVVLSEDFQDGQRLEGVQFLNPFNENFEIEGW